MRSRIALAVIGSVVVALLLAGLGTLVLSRAAAQRTALDELEDQAAALAELVSIAATPRSTEPGAEPRIPRLALDRLSDAFEVEEIGLLVITANGRTLGTLPPELELSTGQMERLAAAGTISGRERGLLYAAEGRTVGRVTVVVALTAEPEPLLRGGVGWFLLASAAVVALASVVALRLASRLARPVRDTTEVTERIAGGDLSARLPGPDPSDRSELAVLARSVNSMADSLERSRVLEQQFLLSVSHDLRTPLTNIRGYAEAITDGAAEPPAAAAAVILAESARLERLVRDLLDLARLDSRQFTFHPREGDLVGEAAAAAEAFGADLASAGLELDVRTVGRADGRADLDRLAQVVGNLVANASRYARSRVVVEARAESEARAGAESGAGAGAATMVVTVTDDGPGIAPADLPHVFERLYQATDQPVRAESGSGLGLAIVRELVAAMGGEVGVTSPPTGGTTFWFRIPAVGSATTGTVA